MYDSNVFGDDLSDIAEIQRLKERPEAQWQTSYRDLQLKRAIETNLNTSKFIYDNSSLSGPKSHGPGQVDLEVEQYLANLR